MGKIKNATCGDYIITQSESGSIKVAKDYANDKQGLREIAGIVGLAIEPSWNTRQLGRKLIELINGEKPKTNEGVAAEYGEYVIFQTETGSIQVFKDYDNVKGALREISDSIGFSYDANWNTRQFGSKLIDKING